MMHLIEHVHHFLLVVISNVIIFLHCFQDIQDINIFSAHDYL